MTALGKTKIEVGYTIDDELAKAIRRANGASQLFGGFKAVKAAAAPIKKSAVQLAPRGKTRTEGKPLYQTIAIAVRRYGDVTVAVVGPQYPAGAHGHLVEFGHAKAGGKGRVGPKPFMRPAVDGTKTEQEREFNKVLKRELAKIKSI